MPRCAVQKLVAEAELPILPFLAPRVFQPWPLPLSRCFSSTPCGRSRQRGPTYENARSVLAHQWYEAALAAQQPDARPAKYKPTGTRNHVRESQYQRQCTLRAVEKSRWTAAKRFSSTRIKWVSLGQPVRRRGAKGEEELAFDTNKNFLYWNHHFAKLNARHDSHLSNLPDLKTTPNLNYRSQRWATKILAAKHINNFQDLESLLAKAWQRKWMHALLWALANSPDDALRLLHLTHVSPYLPALCIADSLAYLARHFSVNPVPEETRQNLVDVFCTVMERPGASPLSLAGSFLRTLLRICTEDEVMRLYESAVGNGAHIHWNTRLHLATYFARSGRFDQALGSLLDAVADGANVKSSQFESNCATLLRKAADHPDGLRVSLRLVQNLSELGVQLNVQLCNIVMLGAVEAGDLKTAFSIYHSLVDHNIQADKYTHAILLKGCKTAIDDSEALNTTIRQAIADTEALKSHVVATEIIHCLWLHHSEADPANSFPIITEAFAQLFDCSELVKLRVLPENLSSSSTAKMRPSLAALGIMIGAYLRQLAQQNNRNTNTAYDIYYRWRRAVDLGERPYVNLALTDHVYNAFLLAFTQDSSGLVRAAEVIRDMQKPFPPRGDGGESSFIRAKPTVRSWSIFLNGFAKHGKMDLAEQVLVYMRGRGMEPNEVTWNSLLNGYARLGRSDEAVAAFIRMRDAGFEATDATQRALSKVRLDQVSPGAWRSGKKETEHHQSDEHTQSEQKEKVTDRPTHREQEDDGSIDSTSVIAGGMHALSV